MTGLFGNYWLFLTTDIVENLAPDQISAVLTYEHGHATNRHLLKRIEFVIGYWFAAFWFYLNVLYNVSILWYLLLAGVLYLFVGLGWLGRRQEFEADAYSATQMSPTATRDALASIVTSNGVPQEGKVSGYSATRYLSVNRRIDRWRSDFVQGGTDD